MTLSSRVFARLGLVLSLALPVAANAQSWDAGGGASTAWSTPANWSGDAIPASGANVAFGAGSTATVDSARTVGTLTFNRDANFLLDGVGPLTINSGITSSVPTRNSRTYTISAPVVLGGNVTLTVNANGGSSGTILISGGISETGGVRSLTKTGYGNVQLSGANSYTGVTSINNGVLALLNNTATLAGSAVTTSGGTNVSLTVTNNAAVNDTPVTRAASLTLNGGGFSVTGPAAFRSREVITGALTIGAGPSVLTVDSTGRRTVIQAASLDRTDGGYTIFRGDALGATGANGTVDATESNIVFTSAPSSALLTGGGGALGTPQVSIFAWAVADTSLAGVGSTFALYDAGVDGIAGNADDRGIRALTVAEAATTASGAAVGDNVRIAANDTLSASKAVNSLHIAGGATNPTLTVNAGSTLTISSGALLMTGASTTASIVGAGSLNFGTSTEAFITATGGTKTINNNISAAATTYKYGDSTLSLTGIISDNGATPASIVVSQGQLNLSNAANSFTGNITVERGRLQVNANAPEGLVGALGNSTSPIILGTSLSTQSETIVLGLNNGVTFGRDIEARQSLIGNPDSQRYRIVVDSGTATVSASSTLTMGALTGPAGRRIELTSGTALGAGNTTLLDYQGLLAQTGNVNSLLINGSNSGTGSVRLSNAGNSYTTGTTVVNGTVRLAGTVAASGNSVIGTGSLNMGEGATPATGATLRFIMDGTYNFARTVTLTGTAGTTGSVTLVIGNDVAGATSTFTGNINSNADVKARNLQLLAGEVNTTVTFAGIISANTEATTGITSLEKTGWGTVVLTGANTYDGTTTISAGNLQVGNAGVGQTGTAAVTLNGATAVLSGTGSVRGATTLTVGIIRPGDNGGAGLGDLRFTSGLTIAPGSSMLVAEFTLQSEPALTSDQISVTGDLVLNAFSNFSVLPMLADATFVPVLGESYTIMDWTGMLTLNGFDTGPDFRDGSSDSGTNLDLPNISSSGYVWDISALVNGATGGALTVTVSAVPEPSRALLLLTGLAFAFMRRRRTRA